MDEPESASGTAVGSLWLGMFHSDGRKRFSAFPADGGVGRVQGHAMGTVPKTFPLFIDALGNQDEACDGKDDPKGVKGNESRGLSEKMGVSPDNSHPQKGDGRADQPKFFLSTDKIGFRRHEHAF